MYILATLIFESYFPKSKEQSYLFKKQIREVLYNSVKDYDKIVECTNPSLLNDYIKEYGPPVRPLIISLPSNPDAFADVLAKSDEIGWWDEDPNSDELRDVKVSDFNYILEMENSMLEIEIDEDLFEEHYVAKAVIYLSSDK